MKLTFVFYFLIVAAGTGGELCVARAMKAIGNVSFRPGVILKAVGRAFQIPWMWLGIAMMTVAFFSLLEILSIENVSKVVPATALSYGAGALGGKIFLKEKITLTRWLGVALVCLGVALVFLGKTS